MKIYLLIKYYAHKYIQNFLNIFNLRITNNKIYEENIKKAKYYNVFNLIKKCEENNIKKIIKYFPKSHSQWSQDLFVLNMLNFKTDGFFVEFGACDGVKLSNTHLLEKTFQWKGILSEPAKFFQKDLDKNRSCFKEFNCVSNQSNNEITFKETIDKELSTVLNYSSKDRHKIQRELGKTYSVKTISLNDMLAKYNCPCDFDYLSIDTEGSEFQIIDSLNFDKYLPKIITIEHNYIHEKRDKINNLLIDKGYKRIFEDISCCDDWYINSKITKNKN